MRVGIWLGKIMKEDVGGGATFQLSLLDEIAKSKSNHQFYLFVEDDDNCSNLIKNYGGLVNFINIKNIDKIKEAIPKRKFFKKSKKKNSAITLIDDLINEEIKKNKIEFFWFICHQYLELKIPYAFTIWDLAHRLQTYFPEVSISGWKYQDRENFYQKMIGKSSFAIIGNNAGARQINQFYNYPLERIKTIPMPTPNYVYNLMGDDNILTKHNLKTQKYLFYPAQFWPHKNHIRLLKTLKILQQKNINFDLVFTGSNKGNMEYIKQKTQEFGLENFVKFLGFVSKEEIISLYKNAFALTYSSIFGPDNIPPLEAMALNCPVICSDYIGAKEQLQDCALFFNPLNENEIVEQIINLQNNSQLRIDLQNRGAILASQVNTQNYLKSLIKILDEFQPIREMWSSDKEFIHL